MGWLRTSLLCSDFRSFKGGLRRNLTTSLVLKAETLLVEEVQYNMEEDKYKTLNPARGLGDGRQSISQCKPNEH